MRTKNREVGGGVVPGRWLSYTLELIGQIQHFLSWLNKCGVSQVLSMNEELDDCIGEVNRQSSNQQNIIYHRTSLFI